MYINFEFLNSKGFYPFDVIILQYLRQLRVESMNIEMFNAHINKLEEDGYVDRLKDGSPRLSKKGKEFLDLVQIPGATENHVALADYLIEKYKNDEDKILCSKNKLVGLISWFCAEANVTPRELYNILEEYWKTDESVFNKKIDYLFFKPTNAYEKRNINNSRLYIYYINYFNN